jgi:hypothetical protein
MADDFLGIGKAVESADGLTKEARELIHLFLRSATKELGLLAGDALRNVYAM